MNLYNFPILAYSSYQTWNHLICLTTELPSVRMMSTNWGNSCIYFNELKRNKQGFAINREVTIFLIVEDGRRISLALLNMKDLSWSMVTVISNIVSETALKKLFSKFEGTTQLHKRNHEMNSKKHTKFDTSYSHWPYVNLSKWNCAMSQEPTKWNLIWSLSILDWKRYKNEIQKRENKTRNSTNFLPFHRIALHP